MCAYLYLCTEYIINRIVCVMNAVLWRRVNENISYSHNQFRQSIPMQSYSCHGHDHNQSPNLQLVYILISYLVLGLQRATNVR